MKKTWKEINKILHKNKARDTILCVTSEKGIESNPYKIANEFNDFYTTIATKLVTKIKTNKSFGEFLDPKQQNSMFISPVTIDEIELCIKELDSKKASDIYGMSAKFLKIMTSEISEPLCMIFNESFSKGIFPDHMKLAMILPFYKGGSKLEVSNYRPVSVLPIISKILEKLMLQRLTSFMEKNKIIYEHQFGFQKNKSTTLAVVDLYTKIVDTLDKGNYACSVFLDFAKAFDTVNHKILVSKLENYGIRGTVKQWFESYLNNRKQTVKIGNTFSDEKQITCGVPQGSILGPILFLLYINDIKNSAKQIQFFLFADDTSTYLTHKNIEELEKIYNKELKKVKNWLDANKLSLNVSKSNMILFKKNRTKTNQKLTIKIMDEEIKEKEYTKYLGILIDNKLTWKQHINHVNLKVTKGLAILYKLRNYVSEQILRMLYFSFIQPHIDYGLLIWGNATTTNLKPIKKKIEKAVRIISFKNKQSPTEPLFDKLRIFSFEKQRILNIAKFMWKVANNETPNTIASLFSKRHRVYGDNNYKYYIPTINTDLMKRNIIYQGPVIWNTIPSEIKNKKNIFSFKNAFRKHMRLQ